MLFTKTRPMAAALALAGLIMATLAYAEKPRKGVPSDAPKGDFEANYFQGQRAQIDGSFSDWSDTKEVPAVVLTSGEYEYDWTSERDLSATVKVQYNDESLFIGVHVLDNALKAPAKKQGGDAIELWIDLGARVKSDPMRMIRVDPSYLLTQQAPDVLWEVPKARRNDKTEAIKTAGMLNNDGYEVEIELPFSEFADLAPVFQPLSFCVVIRDWDQDDKEEDEASVATCPLDTRANKRKVSDMGVIRWETRENIWQGVLAKMPDLAEKPTLSVVGNIGGDLREEEVVLAGAQLIVMGAGLAKGDWQAFDLKLSPEDGAKDLHLKDLDGDKDKEIILTTVQRYNNGKDIIEQHLLLVFDFGEFISDPILAVEIENRLVGGDAFIQNDVEFGKKSVTVSLGKSSGWTADDYPDVDGGFHDNYESILLPWSTPKKRVYTRKGEVFVGK
ncbi:MAG: hypothetical protein COW42_13410 [Deltaproteobacteria bacterium CG17_big_fil_post_rev_8_21_14_2_50_63_7]|nr:MAG: hypothetical protein COW42_13410 [Deltaproteobacteria bacterium CG17_big_fil_post_rev_8_21_14_2_50_63_7]